MKILIADDEPLARLRLQRLVEDISSEFVVYATARNGQEAVDQCIEHRPDLALLDIRMPTMDGLQAASEIAKANPKTQIVFVTAYDEHALEAFDKNAIDYLLKPVKLARIQQTIEKAARFNTNASEIAKPTSSAQAPRQHLCAQTHVGLKRLNICDILFFKADNKYVLAVTSNDSILLEEPLKALEEEFNEHFFRIHRNALVNISAIQSISKSSDGQFHVHLKGSHETLTISRRHQAELNRLLRQKP